MNRVMLPWFVVTFLLATTGLSHARPNIVLYLADDHGHLDSPLAGNTVVKMPVLEKLAAEGMNFTHVLAAAPTCTPSRTAIFTGLFPVRNGAHQNHTDIHEGVETLPSLLNGLGYRTVLAGKRHFGPLSAFPFEYTGKGDQDLQSFFQSVTPDQPFALILATSDPHHPHRDPVCDPADIVVPPYMVDTPPLRELMAGYYADIDWTDQHLGKVLEWLEDSGQRDNTVVIYTSDHGAPLIYGKWTLYDSGLKVPFVVRWPGVVEPASSSDALVSLVDLFATFIDLAGGTPREDIDSQSIVPVLRGERQKLRQYCYGVHSNRGIIQGSAYPSRSVRDPRYNYIRNLNPGGRMTNIFTQNARPLYTRVWNSWKKAARTDSSAAQRVKNYQKRPAEELFDTVNDPFELNNLAEDPKHRATLERMRAAMDDWMLKQGDLGMETELAPLRRQESLRKPSGQ